MLIAPQCGFASGPFGRPDRLGDGTRRGFQFVSGAKDRFVQGSAFEFAAGFGAVFDDEDMFIQGVLSRDGKFRGTEV